MKMTRKNHGGVLHIDTTDDSARKPLINWGSGEGEDVVAKLATEFPVTDEEAAAAALIFDWFERYRSFNEDQLEPLLRSSRLSPDVRSRLFEAYRNSLGILASVQVAIGMLADHMSAEAFVDPVLARAMRSASRDEAAVDEAFEAHLPGAEPE